MRTKSLVVCIPLALGLVAACSSAAPESARDRNVSEGAISDDPPNPLAAKCELPLHYQPDPLAEQRARDRLAIISPDATLSWSSTRATLAQAAGLDLPLDDCEPGGDLRKAIENLLDSEPDVFRFASKDWQGWPAALSCDQPPLDQWLGVHRTSLEGSLVRADTLSLRLRETKAGLVLSHVAATYLPDSIPGLAERLESCPTLSLEQARELTHAASLPYEIFDFCAPQGYGAYKPKDGDTVALGETFVAWSQPNPFGPVDIFLRTEGTLVVAPENHTPELLQSTAYCPPTVGFRLTFEPTKPELVDAVPGIDCVVCLAGSP